MFQMLLDKPSFRKDVKDQRCWGITFIQSCVVLFKYHTTVEIGRFHSIIFFIILSPPAPIPTPTYFLHPHELTASEGQMNSTFLPSWAVTGPHTAEACLINETRQDVRSIADSHVWNNLLESLSQCEALSPCCCLGKCRQAPGAHGGALVNHSGVVSNLLSDNVGKICRSSLHMNAEFHSVVKYIGFLDKRAV